jgi:hypothetical protein
LFELLYGGGLRVQEGSGVALKDIRPDETILIHGKGGKDRLVPVGRCLRAALDAYLPERKKMLRKWRRKSPALFFSVSNQTRNRLDETITVRSVGRILGQVCKAKGLKPMNPRLFKARLRHSHAQQWGIPGRDSAALGSRPHFDNGGLCLRLNGTDAQDLQRSTPARELAGGRFSQILGHDQLGCDGLLRPGIHAVDDEQYNGAHPHARPGSAPIRRESREYQPSLI